MTFFSQYGLDDLATGGMLTLAVTLLSLYLIKKSHKYLYLAVYFFIQSIILAVMKTTASNALFDNVFFHFLTELPFLLLLSVLFMTLFLRAFFKVNQYKKVTLITYGGVLFTFVVYLLLPDTLSFIITYVAHLQLVLLLAIASFYCVTIKHSNTRVFIAILLMYSLCFITNIVAFGWSSVNSHSFFMAYWLAGCLLFYLLSHQIISTAEKQNIAESQAIKRSDNYKLAYQELLAQQEASKEHLESRVQERTLELNIALQELEEANHELEQKNTLDELTGLFNRRYYDQKLLAELRRSRRNLTPLSLVVIDIDHFKKVNDNYGHSVGDQCLIKLGQLIKQVLRRSSDIGCRYGGEEFCLILPETDRQGAVKFAQELRELVMSTAFMFDNRSINLTISCGVCTYQQEKDMTPVELFDGADKALYQAKANGRNQVQIAEI
ncbi:diguanylate cyclase [Colwelliaceae bacterium 6441]